jgi:hypothetical protein
MEEIRGINPADKLPRTANGEAAFAASNTNIVIKGNNTWIVSGGMKARVFYSADKGILGKYTIRQLYKGAMTGILLLIL